VRVPITSVTVTGTILDASQNPASGQITFTPATGITDAGGNPVITSITDAGGLVVVAMVGVTEQLNRGMFSVELIPTDTAGLLPVNWLYQVTVDVQGIPAYSSLYYIPPMPSPVDLSQLVPVPAPMALDEFAGTFEWSLTMAQGSSQAWNIKLTVPFTVSPFPVDPAAWQYVVRAQGDDGTGTPLVSITPAASADGLLTITDTPSLSQVLLQIYPAGTQDLAPGSYAHGLWEFPGNPVTARAMFTGDLIIEAAPQPT
jgi:hypothetical protein